MFSFEKLSEWNNNGYLFACTTLENFCNALINGKTIAFQLDHTDKFGGTWTTTIDPVDLESLNELIAMAKLFNESGAWYINPYLELYDAYYEASIE